MDFWIGLKKDIGEIKTGFRELRQFGWLVMVVCFVLVGVLAFSGRINYGLLLVFALFGIVTNWKPHWWKWPLLVWMTFSLVLGALVSLVILNLIFWLLLTPIGVLSRLARGDFMKIRINKNKVSSSYWIPCDDIKSSDPTKMF